jgi:hypothetical protein
MGKKKGSLGGSGPTEFIKNVRINNSENDNDEV